MARKQTNANFQLEVAGINANMYVDQNVVGINCNINIQYQLDRKTGEVKFLGMGGKEPIFADIKSAITAELKTADSEYAELIPVPETPAV